MTDAIEIALLPPDDVKLFHALDRAEQVDGRYRWTAEGLLLTDHRETLSGWQPGLLEKYLPIWGAAARAGCPLIGARVAGQVMGLVVLNPRHRGTLSQMMSLYVDRRARRKGVAGALCKKSFEIARAAGADRMYVSASPTRGTVGFYWSMGFRPASMHERDAELYALEPKDIHMIRRL